MPSCMAAKEGTPRQDRAWKIYSDQQSGYCVSYPSRWVKSAGFQSSGLSVTTGVTRYGMPIASLDVSLIPDEQPTLKTRAVSLAENYQDHLIGLRRYIKAEQIETLEEKPLAVSGLNALFTRARYYDPLEKSDWIEEIVFTRREGSTYRLELQTKADSWQRFRPIFQHFVDSFQLDCPKR